MAVFNLGSINADLFYQVTHLLAPGETLASTDHSRGLGGKGANMSVAIARAAARAVHIGAVGADGRWAVERLLEYGVDTRNIVELDVPTGHAVIMVDDYGENAILLFPGANRALTEIPVTPVDTTGAGDTFTGFLVAALDRGLPMKQAILLGQQAGAIMVTRHGTADVIPDLKDIEDARFS